MLLNQTSNNLKVSLHLQAVEGYTNASSPDESESNETVSSCRTQREYNKSVEPRWLPQKNVYIISQVLTGTCGM